MDIADLYNMLSFRYGFLDDSELKDELVKLVTDGISPYSLPDIYAVSGYMNIKPSEAVNILNIDNSESVNTFKALDASVEDKTYCEMIYDAVKYVEEVEYTYNSANLLSTLKQGDIVSYKYTYIPNGNISDIDDYVNNLHTRYSYSGRNQLVSEISRNTETNSITNNISYEYDAAGNRIYINGPGYEFEYRYKEKNRLIPKKEIISVLRMMKLYRTNMIKTETGLVSAELPQPIVLILRLPQPIPMTPLTDLHK